MTWTKEQREKWMDKNYEEFKKKQRDYQARRRRKLGIPEAVPSPLRAKILEIRKTLKMKDKNAGKL